MVSLYRNVQDVAEELGRWFIEVLIVTYRPLVLVTGGGGYIGSVLVRKLLQQGYRVRVLDALYWGLEPASGLGVEFIMDDILNADLDVFDGVEYCCHLAGFSNDPTADADPQRNEQVNNVGAGHIAFLAKQAGVKRFTYASSASLYDREEYRENPPYSTEIEPIFPVGNYSISKHKGEGRVLLYGDDDFRPVIFRQATVYGDSPRMRFDLVVNTMVKTALTKGEVYVHGGGHNFRPLISVDQVAEAHVSALRWPDVGVPAGGRIYNTCSMNVSVSHIADHVKKGVESVVGQRIRRIDTPYPSGVRVRNYRVSATRLAVERSIIYFADDLSAVAAQLATKWNGKDVDDPRYSNIAWMEFAASDHTV